MAWQICRVPSPEQNEGKSIQKPKKSVCLMFRLFNCFLQTIKFHFSNCFVFFRESILVKKNRIETRQSEFLLLFSINGSRFFFV